MFSYKDSKIISSVPAEQIKAYLKELGAVENQEFKYDLAEITIEITPYNEKTFPDLGIPRHTITVSGDQILAEDFLTEFRLRFLSAGG